MLFKVVVIFGGLVSIASCQFFDTRYRLPKTTYPIEYNIWLNVSLDSNAFNGEVEIQIGVATATNQITLRQYDLKLNTIELYEIDGVNRISIPIVKGMQFIEHTLPLLVTDGMLEIGKLYSLKFEYTAKSVSSARGIFRSIDINSKTGHQSIILASNFMPQYASSVFPCYDDPDFKATFKLSIQHPIGYTALSNMRILKTELDAEIMTTTFNETPLLPAHSIALSVLNYQVICDNSGVTICAYYDEQHTADDVRLVLQTAKNVLIELEAYLDDSLALSKLDIIPVDISAPTIGNYGLLINIPSDYYYNPETSSAMQHDRVIRHTIRRMVNLYFINVVSPEWWDDIWIIDGISLLLEHTIANRLYPETDATNEFINSLYEHATKRIVYLGPGLLDIAGIESMLDSKYQNRAAAIMYMIQNIVGLDIFESGLKAIVFSKESINSVTFFNTFNSLGFADDLNKIMNTWIKQDSYPILNVRRDYDKNIVTLTQDDVLNVYSKYVARTNLFWLPVNSIKQYDDENEWAETSITGWLENIREVSLSIVGLEDDEWLVYNKELSGFYHTNYDEHNWNLIAAQLDTDFTVFPWITRTQLVHDSILFALNDRLTLDVVFKIANYTSKENEFAPLVRFISGFNELDAIIFGTSVYSNFTKFTAHKIQHLYKRVRITDLNDIQFDLTTSELKLRKSVIELACHMGLEECLIDSNNLVKDLVDEVNGIEFLLQHEFGETVLYNGMALADSHLFRKIFALQDTLDYNVFVQALGHIQNDGVIDDLLDVLITKNGERISEIEINLSGSARRDIFDNLLNYNLAALDKSLTFAIVNSNVIKELWFDSSSISKSFLDLIKTDERLEKFLEIDNIYGGKMGTYATANVESVNAKILEFEATLSKLVEYLGDDEDNGEGSGEGGETGSGGGSGEGSGAGSGDGGGVGSGNGSGNGGEIGSGNGSGNGGGEGSGAGSGDGGSGNGSGDGGGIGSGNGSGDGSGDGSGNGSGDGSGDGGDGEDEEDDDDGAVTATVSSLLLAVMAVLVHLYQ